MINHRQFNIYANMISKDQWIFTRSRFTSDWYSNIAVSDTSKILVWIIIYYTPKNLLSLLHEIKLLKFARITSTSTISTLDVTENKNMEASHKYQKSENNLSTIKSIYHVDMAESDHQYQYEYHLARPSSLSDYEDARSKKVCNVKII